VLDLKLRAFRDPKVFWYEPEKRWIMVAVLSDAKKVTFYGSKDLKAWQHLGDFGPAGVVDGIWECPDLFALPAAGSAGELRWILKVDVYKSATAVGSGAQYFLGGFDGSNFVPESGGSARPVDYGKDFYAAASWSNLPAGGRHLWIAWMNNHEYAQDTPTTPWRGMMSVPRAVSLRRTAAGFELLQSPVTELTSLRSHHRRHVSVPLGREPTLLDAKLDPAAEIVATLQAGSADELGIWTRELRAPILLAVLVALFNQLSGINAILYFAPRIFELTGLSEHAALLQSLGIGVTNLIFTFLGLWLIDRVGRRTLLFAGSCGYIVSLSLVAWAFFTAHFSIVPAFIFVFIAAHAVGQGAVIWVLISEVFPNEHRAEGQALGSFTHWSMAALVTSVFPTLVSVFAPGYVFTFFCAMMILQLIWVKTMVVETKGVPLEQVRQRLRLTWYSGTNR
jgi:Sugar (and other) transporter/Glycosyl hydrolases family 32 N-terminal domain